MNSLHGERVVLFILKHFQFAHESRRRQQWQVCIPVCSILKIVRWVYCEIQCFVESKFSLKRQTEGQNLKMFGSNKSISDFIRSSSTLSSTVIRWRRKQSSPTFGFHWNASMWIFREHISPWQDLTLFGRAIPEGFLIISTWVDASQEHLFFILKVKKKKNRTKETITKSLCQNVSFSFKVWMTSHSHA